MVDGKSSYTPPPDFSASQSVFLDPITESGQLSTAIVTSTAHFLLHHPATETQLSDLISAATTATGIDHLPVSSGHIYHAANKPSSTSLSFDEPAQTQTTFSVVLAPTLGSTQFVPIFRVGTPTIPVSQTSYLSLQGTVYTTEVSQSGSTHQSSRETEVSQSGSTRQSSRETGVIDGMHYTLVGDVLSIDEKTIETTRPTTATLNNGDVLAISPTGGVSITKLTEHVSPARGVTQSEYIIGAFVPTVLAVLFSIPWQLLARSLQEMEPFYQLHRTKGAFASSSLLLDYKSSINLITTFSAAKRGHFLVCLSGLISLAVLALAPLASETVFIGFLDEAACTANQRGSTCIPALSVNPVVARLVQGLLAFIAFITLALAILMYGKRSGVFANPQSIASVATLFQDHSVAEDFRHLAPSATDQESLQAGMLGQRYKLGRIRNKDGSSDYGITFCDINKRNSEEDGPMEDRDENQYKPMIPKAMEDCSPSRTKARLSSTAILMHPASYVVYGLLLIGLEITVLYYDRTGGNTGFNRFMTSNSFGVAFLFTATGVAIKLYWTLLDDSK